jgi:D-3-phosphoglycerate dehydrogenase / 2-oxoglutarate reductase
MIGVAPLLSTVGPLMTAFASSSAPILPPPASDVIRILMTDDIDPEGVAVLAAEPSLTVEVVPTLPAAELLERIEHYDALVGRSATRITSELLTRGRKLRVVGRAGVGVDNIALPEATRLGVAVVNAPAGNTIAVAELFFGSLISLLRHISSAAISMQAGRWDRSQFLGSELFGRTLGIVGLGRIGGEVAHRAKAFGMTVLAYDPYVPVERFHALQVTRAGSLDELLRSASIATLHVPLTPETRDMIGRRELALLPAGAIVANLARGGIVEDQALEEALVAGGLRGALLDVFAVEPLPPDARLRSMPNVVLTPHIGASTAEAQRNVAVDVCVAVRDLLLRGELSRSINLAAVDRRSWDALQPALLLARRAAAIGRALLGDRGVQIARRITVRVGSELAGASGALLSSAALGVMENVVEVERLNLISARALAEARGIELAMADPLTEGHPYGVEVVVGGGMETITVGGIAPLAETPRLTQIGAFSVNVAPRQTLVILTNRDVPGVIGHVGTLLGAANVNIAEYHQARLTQGGDALAAIAVDGTVDESLRRALLELPDVLSATAVDFRRS